MSGTSDIPDRCDVCGRAGDLNQHCYISTGVQLPRAHFLCDQCMIEFPVPDDEVIAGLSVTRD
jgi:hypothetical protein